MDGTLCCSQKTQLIMDVLALTYDMKAGSVGLPTFYLGAEIKKYKVKSGKYHWIMPITQYAKNTINTVEGLLKDGNR